MSSTAPQRTRRTAGRPLPRAVERARLTVVPRLRPGRAPRVPFLALVSLLLLAGVVGLLLFNTSMQQASFTASRLEAQAADLSAREAALEAEIEDLRDPQRIAEAACAQGMVIGATSAFLDVETGRVTGTAAAAEAGACGVRNPAPAQPMASGTPASGAGQQGADGARGTNGTNGANGTNGNGGNTGNGGAGGTDGAAGGVATGSPLELGR